MVRLLLLVTGATLALSAAALVHSPNARRHAHQKHRATTDSSSSDDDAAGAVKTDNTTALSGTTSAIHALFPQSGVSSAWTVANAGLHDAHVFNLTDETFIVHKQVKSLKHPVVHLDGKKAFHGRMPRGAFDLQRGGGFSFYSPGPKGKGDDPIIDLTKARELSFSYSVKFSKGYDFNLGGKLPGLYGGTNADIAAKCSGGNHSTKCFSTRFMFRKKGAGELYLYIPPDLNRKNLCGDKGTSKCRGASSNGKTYGASVGTGLWTFKPGQWTTLRQVIHLNTPGKRDGFAQVYVNGSKKPVLDVQNISFRDSSDSTFVGVFFSYFHGGHTSNWAARKDQDAWFSDFTIAVTETDD